MSAPAFARRFKRPLRAMRADTQAYSPDRKIIDEALAWLDGQPGGSTAFKIETRRSHDGAAWRHVLMNGVLGYSARNDLVTIEA